jgi:hypothetical protein
MTVAIVSDSSDIHAPMLLPNARTPDRHVGQSTTGMTDEECSQSAMRGRRRSSRGPERGWGPPPKRMAGRLLDETRNGAHRFPNRRRAPHGRRQGCKGAPGSFSPAVDYGSTAISTRMRSALPHALPAPCSGCSPAGTRRTRLPRRESKCPGHARTRLFRFTASSPEASVHFHRSGNSLGGWGW